MDIDFKAVGLGLSAIVRPCGRVALCVTGQTVPWWVHHFPGGVGLCVDWRFLASSEATVREREAARLVFFDMFADAEGGRPIAVSADFGMSFLGLTAIAGAQGVVDVFAVDPRGLEGHRMRHYLSSFEEVKSPYVHAVQQWWSTRWGSLAPGAPSSLVEAIVSKDPAPASLALAEHPQSPGPANTPRA